jgi:cellobiose phosphorylase
LERILGIQRTAEGLRFQPVISPDWEHYQVMYRFGKTVYLIQVENPEHVQRGVVEVRMDGHVLNDGCVPWLEDGQEHKVIVYLGHPAETNGRN